MTWPEYGQLTHWLSLFGENIAVGMIAVVIYASVRATAERRPSTLETVLLGLLFGISAVFSMLLPVEIGAGIRLDARNVFVLVGSFASGPLGATIAMALPTAFRLYVGGVGMVAGIGSVLCSGLFGILIYRRYGERLREFSIAHFALIGLIDALITVVWPRLVFAWEGVPQFQFAAELTVIIVFPLATAILGSAIYLTHYRVWLRSQRRLAEILHTMSEIVWEIDEQERFTFVSSRFREILGFEANEILGRTSLSLGGRLLDEPAQAAFDSAFAARKPYDNLPYIPPTKDGTRKIFSISGRPVFNSQGRFLGYRGTATDITERENWRAVLTSIAGRVDNVVGPDFLRTLVQSVTEVLGAEHAIIGVYENGGKEVRTLVRFAAGRFCENQRNNIEGMPSAEVYHGKPMMIRSGFAERYPRFVEITSSLAEAYAATPLIGSRGTVLGLLSVAFTHPLDGENVETVLQLFAGRAAAEIERIEIEDEWRASRDRLMTAQRIGKIASIEVDLQRGLSIWSPEMWPMIGLQPTVTTPSFERFLECVHPEDREMVRQLRGRSAMGYNNEPGTFRVVRPNGEVRWIYRQAELARDGDGKPTKLAVMLQDITDRLKLEHESQRSREHLLLAQRTAGIGSAEVNVQTGEEYWSPELIHILGLQGEAVEFTFDRFMECVHPDDREMLRALRIRNNAGAPTASTEFRIIRPDGTVRWLRRQVQRLFDSSGILTGLIATHQDVTERRQLEETLRASNHWLLRAQRLGKIGSATIDFVAGTIEWSEEQYRMFGLDPAEGGASYERFLSLVHPEDREIVRSVREQNARGMATPPIEFRVVRPDGAVRWLVREVEVECDAAGRPLRFLATQQDITERHVMEDTLRQNFMTLVRAQRMGQIGSAEIDLVDGTAVWSEEQRRIYGLAPTEPTPDLEDYFAMVHPDDRALVRATRTVDGTGDLSEPIDFRIVRKDGVVRWIHREVDVQHDEAGNPIKLYATQQDITDRKRMEDELRASAQHLASAQRVGKMASVEYDLQTKRTVWSMEAYRLFGVDPVNGQPTRMGFLELVHPEDRQRLLDRWEYEKVGHETEPFEYRLVGADGEMRWIYRRAEFLRDIDGNPTRLIMTHLDVTAREELRRLMATLSGNFGNTIGEDFLKALVVSVARVLGADYAYIGRPDMDAGRIQTQYLFADGSFVANDSIPLWEASRTILASGKSFLVNGGLRDRIPEVPRILNNVIDAYAGTPLFSAKGELLGILVASSRGPWERPEYVETVLNLSAPRAAAEIERLANEAEAQRSRKRMAEVLAALDIARDAVIMADGERRVVYANDAAISLLGLPGDAATLEGKRLGDFQDGEFFGAYADEVLATVMEKGEWQGTGPWRRPLDGREMFFDARIHRLPQGGFVAVASDATKRIRLEDEERRRQEWQAQASKLEALGNLAGGIAHDFNNLLGAILGFGQFLIEDLESGSEPHHFAERIVSVSQRGRSLVQQILTFARRGPVEATQVKLDELAGETQELLRATLPATTEFVVENRMIGASVLGDKGQLSQVLVNLCVNGSDALANEQGRVSMTVAPLDRRRPELAHLPLAQTGSAPAGVNTWSEVDGTVWIATGALPTGPTVSIAIKDTGSGISSAVGAQIFEPFFTTKGRGRGTGLGLAVVHRIVLEHGGAILVKTRQEQGTSFEILLPLSASTVERPAVLPPAAEDGERGAGKAAILVVDDDESFCAMVETALKRLGYNVQSTNDPRIAQNWIKNQSDRWDVLVTDQNMPYINGEELVRYFKAHSPATRSILCTGNSSGMTEHRARLAGADGFLLKPFDFDRLAAMVSQLLQSETSPTK